MKDKSYVYVLIGFFSMLIVGLIGFLVYEFMIKDNDMEYVIDAYNNAYVIKARETISEEEQKNYTEDELNTLLGYDFKIPKINLETEAAQKINNDMYDLIKGYTNDLENKRNASDGFIKYDYEYIILDEVIYIKLNYTGYAFPGGGTMEQYLYYYDLKDNKELTNEDIMKKYQITTEDINQKLSNPTEYFPTLSRFYPKDGKHFTVYVPTNEYEGNEVIEIEINK